MRNYKTDTADTKYLKSIILICLLEITQWTCELEEILIMGQKNVSKFSFDN